MAKIKWSKDSINDLKEIYKFIALDSPYYAKLFNDRVFEMVEHLELFPEMGGQVPESDDHNVRDLIYKGYRIIYQIKEGYLEIITVLHGSKLLKL
ncbi:MAG: type II toxin-antitoxin system RelE/ParE family toxin [Candidatus Scalindua rubra]|nr:type II toxin-antitoxin system RelE/ParE family toxin [Candidatus Scalindua rubra]TWU33054.1 Plasmid stabilization system protein [Candidatus Brocadiaceae bacterium S225]